MHAMRTLVALLALAGALLAAGCGGSETPVAGSASAALAPADAGLFVSVASAAGSEQWKRLEALLTQVPGGQDGLAKMLGELAGGSGATWEIRPALGDELLVVVPAGSASPVLLTKPEDEQALADVLEKTGKTAVTAEVEGWTAVAETQQALDTYRAALEQGSLAEDDDYLGATSSFPADALARVFVRAEGLQGAVGRAAGTAESLGPLSGLSGLVGGGVTGVEGTMAMAVSAEEQGLRVEGSATTGGGPGAEEFTPTLLGRVPADAPVAITFKGGDAIGEQLRAQAGGDEEALKQFERFLGVSFDDVARAFSGEAVVYLRSATPVPEITLAIQSQDGTIGKLVDGVIGSLQALGGGDRPAPARETVDGVPVTTIPLDDDVTIAYAQVDRTFVLTTAVDGIRAFRASGARLVDDPGFQRLAADAGLGDTTAGFAFVDVDGLVPLLEKLAASGEDPVPADVAEALASIDGGAINATADGGTTRFEGFLRFG
jgi:hypothetical protein